MNSPRPLFGLGKLLALASLFALLPVVAGCRGDKLATVELSGPGVTGEARYTSTSPVALWSDWDAVWKGSKRMDLPLSYQVEILQRDVRVGQITCVTAGSSTGTCALGPDMNVPHRSRCEVLLVCELPATKPGEVVLRVRGKVLDEINTKAVTRMSVNVRRK